MLTVTMMEVWSTVVEDRPGSLRDKLEGLALAGADLDYIVSRRLHEQPGKSVVFVTPLTTDRQICAAEKLGFKKATSFQTVSVRGPDEPGIANRVAAAVAGEKINVHGVSAARAGNECAMFLSFDNVLDAQRAMARLSKAL